MWKAPYTKKTYAKKIIRCLDEMPSDRPWVPDEEDITEKDLRSANLKTLNCLYMLVWAYSANEDIDNERTDTDNSSDDDDSDYICEYVVNDETNTGHSCRHTQEGEHDEEHCEVTGTGNRRCKQTNPLSRRKK